MKRPQRQQFDEERDESASSRSGPRVWECSANGCPHVGAIRLPGYSDPLCAAHAMSEPRHWQRVTGAIVQHRELLAACRLATSQACGMRELDTQNARALLETAELMPTGLGDFLPPALREKARAAGVRSKVVAMAIERAVVDLALVGAKRKAGDVPKVDEDGEVASAERRFSSLLADAITKVEDLRQYQGMA